MTLPRVLPDRSVLTSLLVLLTLLGSVRAQTDRIAAPSAAALQRKLQNIIIPGVEFRSTTFSEAIDFLQDACKRLDPDLIGGDWKRTVYELRVGENLANSRVTLEMKRVPLLELLRYTVRQAGMKVNVGPSVVSFLPLGGQTDPLVSESFSVQPNYFGETSPGSGDSTEFVTRDARAMLEARGVTFPPGTSALWSVRPPDMLFVHNTRENVRLIERLTAGTPDTPTTEVYADEADLAPQRESNRLALTQKLQSMVVPDLEFRSTTISEAVDFLRDQGLRLDSDPKPENRGVNIFLQLPPRRPAKFPGTISAMRVTLEVRNLTILEALQAAADQAGLMVVVEPYALCLLPPDADGLESIEKNRIHTKEFKLDASDSEALATAPPLGWDKASAPVVPPGIWAPFIRSDTPDTPDTDDSTDASAPAVPPAAPAPTLLPAAPDPDDPRDARPWLRTKGITSLAWAGAEYLPATSKLIVHDTKANLDLIETFLPPAK